MRGEKIMHASKLANKEISMTNYDTEQLSNIITYAANAYPNTAVDNHYSDASYNTTVNPKSGKFDIFGKDKHEENKTAKYEMTVKDLLNIIKAIETGRLEGVIECCDRKNYEELGEDAWYPISKATLLESDLTRNYYRIREVGNEDKDNLMNHYELARWLAANKGEYRNNHGLTGTSLDYLDEEETKVAKEYRVRPWGSKLWIKPYKTLYTEAFGDKEV
jgi:hypothetical protein